MTETIALLVLFMTIGFPNIYLMGYSKGRIDQLNVDDERIKAFKHSMFRW